MMGMVRCNLLLSIPRWTSRMMSSMTQKFEETVLTSIPANCTVFDLTYGDGRLSSKLLDDNHTVVALDRDSACADYHEWEFNKNPQFLPFIGKFSDLPHIIQAENHLADYAAECSAIVLDLGPSRSQIKEGRGFSVDVEATDSLGEELDMRMDRSGVKASDILQFMESDSLAKVFKMYGGVKRSKYLVQDITEARILGKRFKTSDQLVDVLKSCMERQDYFLEDPDKRISDNIRKVFLALRLFVNNELNETDYAIRMAHKLLKPGGHLFIMVQSDFESEFIRKCLFKGVDAISEGVDAVSCRQTSGQRIPWQILEHQTSDNSSSYFVVEKNAQ